MFSVMALYHNQQPRLQQMTKHSIFDINTMSHLERNPGFGLKSSQATVKMAKSQNTSADIMEEDTFYNVWLFRFGYSAIFIWTREEMQQRDAEAAIAVATLQEDMAGRDPPEPELPRANTDRWCLCSNCPAKQTEPKPLYCREFQRGQFLLDAAAAEANPRTRDDTV